MLGGRSQVNTGAFMSKKWKIVLIVSLLCNLSIIYVGYKALDYRDHVNYFLKKYIDTSNELSGRSVFQAEDLKLRSATQIPNRVVFLGTQVVMKWMLPKYFPGYETVNRGIEGQKVAGFLLRFRPDVIDLFPKAVVVEISSYNFRQGTSISEIEDYAASMAELSRYHDITPILMTIIPPTSEYEAAESYEGYSVLDSLQQYNQWLLNYCSTNGMPVVDADRLLSDQTGHLDAKYAFNTVEPNEMGYQVLATAILKQLDSVVETSGR